MLRPIVDVANMEVVSIKIVINTSGSDAHISTPSALTIATMLAIHAANEVNAPAANCQSVAIAPPNCRPCMKIVQPTVSAATMSVAIVM